MCVCVCKGEKKEGEREGGKRRKVGVRESRRREGWWEREWVGRCGFAVTM